MIVLQIDFAFWGFVLGFIGTIVSCILAYLKIREHLQKKSEARRERIMPIIREIRPYLSSCLGTKDEALFTSNIQQIYHMYVNDILKKSLDKDIEKELPDLNRHFKEFQTKINEIKKTTCDKFGLEYLEHIEPWHFGKGKEYEDFRHLLFSNVNIRMLIQELIKDIEKLFEKE